jgi:hypothetical protein
MRALVKSATAEGLTLEEVECPAICRDEVLIRILKTAICGTDVHIWDWDDWAQRTIPVPMIVGHEFCRCGRRGRSGRKGVGEGAAGQWRGSCGLWPLSQLPCGPAPSVPEHGERRGPRGKARIRVQISAAHTREDLDFALDAFQKASALCVG